MRRVPPPGEPPGPGETLDQLIDDWWIFQLKGGHRFSTDDMMVAWRAALASPHARSYLDIGCGIGSVGLYTLGLLKRPELTLVGVEAQAVSVGLARRSVVRNGLAERVTILEGDLRDPEILPEGSTFDLITGSPPYIPLGRGLLSPHPQRAACRIELRGSVIDYCVAARRWLAPGGRFAFVMAAADPRIDEGVNAGGFSVVERMDIVFREGEAPLIAVVVCARQEDGPFGAVARPTLTIRERTGRMTEEYAAIRLSMGFSVDRAERAPA